MNTPLELIDCNFKLWTTKAIIAAMEADFVAAVFSCDVTRPLDSLLLTLQSIYERWSFHLVSLCYHIMKGEMHTRSMLKPFVIILAGHLSNTYTV